MATLSAAIERANTRGRNRLRDALQLIGREARTYHTNITRQWVNKPDWRVLIYREGATIGVKLVASEDKSEIWRYVDEGTGKHGPSHAPYLIFPKPPNKLLRFPQFYSARTQPIARYGVGTGKGYGPLISKPFVLHPGIEGREFTKTFVERRKALLISTIHQVFRG